MLDVLRKCFDCGMRLRKRGHIEPSLLGMYKILLVIAITVDLALNLRRPHLDDRNLQCIITKKNTRYIPFEIRA